jgi:hypothetical protein
MDTFVDLLFYKSSGSLGITAYVASIQVAKNVFVEIRINQKNILKILYYQSDFLFLI